MAYGPLQKAVLQLSKQDNKINEIIVNYGLPNDKMSKGGFETLLRMIVGQQISVKAADAVWSKLKKIKADIPKNFYYFRIINLGKQAYQDKKYRMAETLQKISIQALFYLTNLENYLPKKHIQI